jgi:hypothetical protein
VHTCRALWPEGLASVEAKLLEVPAVRAAYGDRVEIAPKPRASVYVGDNYVNFGGNWPRTLIAMREVAK